MTKKIRVVVQDVPDQEVAEWIVRMMAIQGLSAFIETTEGEFTL